MKRTVVWKTNSQHQLSLLPPSYDDFVPDNHLVGIVNTIIDQIDIIRLLKRPIKVVAPLAIILVIY